MTKQKLESLLGRPLTATESANIQLYLSLATDTLERLLCVSLSDNDSPRVYDAREGYSTVFTDLFSDIYEVKLNGKKVTNFEKRQWGKRNGNWFNSIVFDCKLKAGDEVSIDASFNVDCMPQDLQMVLAGLFNQIGKKQAFDGSVQSKQVEDFRITFKDGVNLDQEFTSLYQATIDKYSQCNIGYLRQEC